VVSGWDVLPNIVSNWDVFSDMIEGGSLGSPLMSNSSSFKFENVQYMSIDNQDISIDDQWHLMMRYLRYNMIWW